MESLSILRCKITTLPTRLTFSEFYEILQTVEKKANLNGDDSLAADFFHGTRDDVTNFHVPVG